MSTPHLVMLILALYTGAMLALSRSARKRIKSVQDTIAAPGQSTIFLLVGSAVGMHIGSGFVVGGAEYGARYGVGGAWYGIGCGISYLAVGLLISRFAYRNQFISLSDYFAKRYRGKSTRLIYSVATMLSCIAMLAGQLLAGRAIFLAVGIPEDWGVVLTAVVSLCYATASGLWGTMAASAIQSAVIFAGMLLALAVMLHGYGVLELTKSLPGVYFDPIPFDSEFFVDMVVPTATVSLVSQGIYQNISAAKTEKVAVWGYLISGLLLLPVALIPPLLGMFGRVLFPAAAPTEVFMKLLLTRLPTAVAAVILAAIICAVVGACNGAYITVAANVVHDIYLGMLDPEADSRDCRRVMLAVDIAVCVIGIFLALRMRDIIQLLALGYSLLTAGCLVPFVGGLLWKRGTTRGALVSAFVGMSASAANSLGMISLPYPSISAVLLSALLYMLVSLAEGWKSRPGGCG